MISLYVKNRPWSGHPRCDYVRIMADAPLAIKGFRINGARVVEEPTVGTYLSTYRGWYHPATAWEIEEFRRMGGA
jgi:hypothetical protein